MRASDRFRDGPPENRLRRRESGDPAHCLRHRPGSARVRHAQANRPPGRSLIATRAKPRPEPNSQATAAQAMANSNLKTHRTQCPDSDCELKLRYLRILERGRIRSCNARWQILWRDPRPARRRTTITSALRPCRSSGRAPDARSPELALDFIKRFHAAFANRRVVRVLTNMRRIIPAAFAFRAVGAKHRDTQAWKHVGFLPFRGCRAGEFHLRNDKERRERCFILFE